MRIIRAMIKFDLTPLYVFILSRKTFHYILAEITDPGKVASSGLIPREVIWSASRKEPPQ